jgi:signal transduction histidine kinase
VWIYWSWHLTLIISFTGYALLKDKSTVTDARFTRLAVALSVVGVFVAAVGLYLFATRYESLLPITFTDVRPISAFRQLVGGATLVILGSAGLCLLWIRQNSLLDQWLMVALFALVLEVFMVSAFGARYSLGWYAGRFYQLVTATAVLIVLLAEMTGLYASLARSNVMLQAERLMLQRAVQAQNREREARLMTGDAISAAIAHEVKQPLSAMIIRADTCFRWLNSPAPDLDKTKTALQRIAADGHRAGAVIESVRANFRKSAQARTEVDIDSLVVDTLQLVSDDVKRHGIFVEVDPNPGLPRVLGDRIQLQQLLLNLLTNAIESMSAKQGRRVLCIKAELGQTGEVEVSVEDTGLGIGEQDIDRVFNPLFTTKSGGMGMGLSICRSIVEAHEGQLWALPNTPEGAVFRFALRAASA